MHPLLHTVPPRSRSHPADLNTIKSSILTPLIHLQLLKWLAQHLLPRQLIRKVINQDLAYRPLPEQKKYRYSQNALSSLPIILANDLH